MSPSLANFVSQAFAEGGLLASTLPSYRPQRHQREYAESVVRALMSVGEGRPAAVSLLEAETGTGKTLAYLVPLLGWAAITGRRVAVSTATIQLQEQLLATDANMAVALEVVERAFGRRLNAALRVGLRHFVSVERARAALAEAITAHPDSDQSLVGEFRAWLDAPGDHLISEWLERYERLPLGLTPEAIACRGDDSEEHLSAYHRHVENARNADVVVANHAVTVLHALNPMALGTPDRPIAALVLDEADRFPGMVDAILHQQVPLSTLRRHLDVLAGKDMGALISPAVRRTSEAVGKAWKVLESVRPSTGNALVIDPRTRHQWHAAAAAMAALSDEMKQLVSAFKQSPAHAARLPEDVLAELAEFAQITDNFTAKMAGDPRAHGVPLITWSKQWHFPSLRMGTPNPGHLFAHLLKGGEGAPLVQAAIVTSAALGDGRLESISQFQKTLGIFSGDTARTIACEQCQVDNFGTVEFVLAGDIPPPTEKQGEVVSTSRAWLDTVTEIVLAATAGRRRAVILTLSNSDTEELATRLEAERGERLLVHARGERLGALLQTYRRMHDGILISAAAWEGVDLPGLIDDLVITRLPFAPADAPEALLLRETLRRKGMSAEVAAKVSYALLLGQARRKFRQGIGRAIRRHDDRVRIWICDPRFPVPGASNRTGSGFVLSLPRRMREGVAGHPSAYESARIWGAHREIVPVENPWLKNSR